MRDSHSLACRRSWSISDDSLRRYVFHASENCIQELLSAACGTESSRGEWKVVAIDDGVELSKCRSGPNQTSRSRRVMKTATPLKFVTVSKDIDAAKFFHAWDADLVEAKYIKGLEENLSIFLLRFGERSKPLFRNREFIVYQRRETMDDGTLVVAVSSLPKEIASGLHPHPHQSSKSIRGLLLQSGWVVEKLQDDSCMVTYIAQLDPTGWLPKWLVNRFHTKFGAIIKNLRNQVLPSPATSGK